MSLLQAFSTTSLSEIHTHVTFPCLGGVERQRIRHDSHYGSICAMKILSGDVRTTLEHRPAVREVEGSSVNGTQNSMSRETGVKEGTPTGKFAQWMEVQITNDS